MWWRRRHVGWQPPPSFVVRSTNGSGQRGRRSDDPSQSGTAPRRYGRGVVCVDFVAVTARRRRNGRPPIPPMVPAAHDKRKVPFVRHAATPHGGSGTPTGQTTKIFLSTRGV